MEEGGRLVGWSFPELPARPQTVATGIEERVTRVVDVRALRGQAVQLEDPELAGGVDDYEAFEIGLGTRFTF